MACIQYGRNALRQIIKDTRLHPSDRMMQPLLFSSQGVRHRKLEVILTTSIEKLGKAGETVKVAPGFFRNHLMPKLLAVPNIDKYAYLIKEQRRIYQPVDEEVVKVVTVTKEDKMKEYEKAAKRLDSTQLVLRRLIDKEKFRTRATKDEPLALQSSVTVDDIVAEVARQFSVQIAPENLNLPSPLSTCGEYEIPLRFPKSIPLPEGKIYWTLKVKVRSK
ncbi:50S ribosomal protein L9 [Benincasa hispida]|uniref:50S ribosomal protein L9 n=1 Tax=Benincasa hispida TaxID=102211 RepID=UPI001901A740|nr:50S ribosomal protein L9 [Benincasa hispida]